jgi:hypothetical protein
MNFLKHHGRAASMVVYDLDIVGVTVYEPKNHPPRAVDGQRPKARPAAGQFVQTKAVQSAQSIKALRAVECLQAVHSAIDLQAGPFTLPGLRKTPGAGVFAWPDHGVAPPRQVRLVEHGMSNMAC